MDEKRTLDRADPLPVIDHSALLLHLIDCEAEVYGQCHICDHLGWAYTNLEKLYAQA